ASWLAVKVSSVGLARGQTLGGMVMPVIVVTRLRLKDPGLLDEFFTDAVAAIEQAGKAEGNLGADALADANNAWSTLSASLGPSPTRRPPPATPPTRRLRARGTPTAEGAFAGGGEGRARTPRRGKRRAPPPPADGTAANPTQPADANEPRAFPPPVEPAGGGT